MTGARRYRRLTCTSSLPQHYVSRLFASRYSNLECENKKNIDYICIQHCTNDLHHTRPAFPTCCPSHVHVKHSAAPAAGCEYEHKILVYQLQAPRATQGATITVYQHNRTASVVRCDPARAYLGTVEARAASSTCQPNPVRWRTRPTCIFLMSFKPPASNVSRCIVETIDEGNSLRIIITLYCERMQMHLFSSIQVYKLKL